MWKIEYTEYIEARTIKVLLLFTVFCGVCDKIGGHHVHAEEPKQCTDVMVEWLSKKLSSPLSTPKSAPVPKRYVADYMDVYNYIGKTFRKERPVPRDVYSPVAYGFDPKREVTCEEVEATVRGLIIAAKLWRVSTSSDKSPVKNMVCWPG